MNDQKLILQEFFVEGTKRDTSHVLLHITEPTTPAERQVGYFFAIAEIEHGSIEQIEQVQTMIDDLETGVYETEPTSQKTGFELTLEYINRRAHHILAHEGALHIIVGTVRDGAIQFAYHGNPTATLVYQQESQGYQRIDIIDDDIVHEDQLFSAVLEGSVSEHDYFFVATPSVLPLLGHNIAHLLSATPPKQTATAIDALAKSHDNTRSYGGIIMTLMTMDDDNETPGPIIPSTAERTRERAHTKVDPSLFQPMGPRTTSRRSEYTRSQSRDEVPLGNQLLVLLGKGIVTFGKVLLMLIVRTLVFCKDVLVNVTILITNAGGQRHYVLDTAKRWIDQKKRIYTNLPIASKILFFATLIVALVFIGSILWLRAREAKELELTTYVNTVQAIMDKRDAAESSLIYGDSERAFVLLDEARNMIDTLPEKTEEDRNQKASLQTDIESLLVSLRNITIVTPDVFANLRESTPSATVDKLVRVGDALIAYGDQDTNHYVINMNTTVVEVRDHSTLPPLQAADAPKEYDYVSFLTGPTDLATLDPTSYTISPATIGAPIETTLIDLALYNRRAYTLSPSSNQIYRHNPTQQGFDGGTAWLTTPTDLSNAVAITIDGDIYVLTSTGEVLKFFGGVSEPFAVTGVDPVLTAPTDIWTYTDVNYLYILEPSQNRLVVLNKDGSLSVQYTAEIWNAPEAFVVNGETNELYILDDNIVYRFSTR